MSLDLSDLLDQAEDGYSIPCRNDAGDVDLFAKSVCGDTLIHVAVGRRRLDEVRYLVDQGLDVNARGDFLATPLYLAARCADIAMIGMLLKLGADAEIPNCLGVLPQEALFDYLGRKDDEVLP